MMQTVNTGSTKKFKIDTRIKISIRCAVIALVVLAISTTVFFSLEKNLAASIHSLSVAAVEKAILNGPDLQGAERAEASKLKTDIDSKLNKIIWLQLGCMIGAGAALVAAIFIGMRGMLIVPAGFINQIKPMAPEGFEFSHGLNFADQHEQHKIDAAPKNWLNFFLTTIETLLKRIATDGKELKQAAEKLAALAGELAAKIKQSMDKNDKNNISVAAVDSKMASLALGMDDIFTDLEGLSATSRKITDSFRPIQQNSAQTRKITASALARINRVAVNAESFNDKVMKIGSIMDLITRLSEQIDLLVLNADIEADPAGKNGKAFARIANETKAMAKKTVQTAEAMACDIGEIQLTASDAVSEIELIRKVMIKADQSIAWIAAEIEEQAGLTKEMAVNSYKMVMQANDITSTMEQQKEQIIQIIEDHHEIKHLLEQLIESGSLMVQTASQIDALSEDLNAIASTVQPAEGDATADPGRL